MQIIEVGDPTEAAACAADLIEHHAPHVLGAATGATPEPLYRLLVARQLVAPTTTVCLLDDYIGLPPGHPQQYRHVIERQLVNPLGLTMIAPDVDAADPIMACRQYEDVLAELGGVDLQILGIGRNGHIGFNEPGTPFDTVTHVVELAATTRADNARFFDGPIEVPTHAITQGIASIRRAKRIVLIAIGLAKSTAVATLLDGPVSAATPASALRDHDDLTVIADREALARRTAIRSQFLGAT